MLLGCTPRRQSAGGVSALPKTGIAALVISLLRRVLWTFFGLCDLQILRQIVRSHPASRTGAKMGSIFAPGFHSAGDGMKATLVISPLRRGFRTFFGLYTAKVRTDKKGAPINKITACPIRSKPFSLFIFLSKCCITPNYTQGAFGLAQICRRSKRTAKRKKSAYTRR